MLEECQNIVSGITIQYYILFNKIANWKKNGSTIILYWIMLCNIWDLKYFTKFTLMLKDEYYNWQIYITVIRQKNFNKFFEIKVNQNTY